MAYSTNYFLWYGLLYTYILMHLRSVSLVQLVSDISFNRVTLLSAVFSYPGCVPSGETSRYILTKRTLTLSIFYVVIAVNVSLLDILMQHTLMGNIR